MKKNFRYKPNRKIIELLISITFTIIMYFILIMLPNVFVCEIPEDARANMEIIQQLGKTIYVYYFISTYFYEFFQVWNSSAHDALVIENNKIIYYYGWLEKKSWIIEGKEILYCDTSRSWIQKRCNAMNIYIKLRDEDVFFENVEDCEELHCLIKKIIYKDYGTQNIEEGS